MGDFLDYAKDIEKGQTDVTPDDLAPEPQNTNYDENKDPEMIKEMQEMDLSFISLREARTGPGTNIPIFVKKNAKSGDFSYAAFNASGLNNTNIDEDKYSEWWYFLKDKRGVPLPEVGGPPPKQGRKSKYESSGEGRTKTGGGIYDEDKFGADNMPKISKDLSGIAQQYGDAELKGSAEEMFQEMQDIVKNIILMRSDKRHALIFGDPGIGKTYEVMETCKRFMGQNPKKARYTYEAGDIGSSMSALVPFMYAHSRNEIIVLDDNDKMLMTGIDPAVQNIMKALLDPKAAEEKPITVRNTMRKQFAVQYKDLMAEQEAEDDKAVKKLRAAKESIIEIDVNKLKEGICRITINGVDVVNEFRPLRECRELLAKVRPLKEDLQEEPYGNRYRPSLDNYTGKKLYEARSNADFLNELLGEDGDEDKDDAGEGPIAGDADEDMGEEGDADFPRRFIFDSSIVFISNLSLDQINTAVLDRCESKEIKLSLQQFLDRLGAIYGGLCKGASYSSVPQDLRDWAKKCVYTALGIAIEAFKTGTVIFGTTVEINRKLTFRMFDEFVVAWIRYAWDRAERIDGKDINDPVYRTQLGKALIPEILRRKMIPWFKLRTKV